MRIRTCALVSLVGLIVFGGFGTVSSTSAETEPPAPADVVATVGSTSITLADVDERALKAPASDFGSMRLSQAVYEARREALDALIGNQLLDQEAKARGVDRATLDDREIAAKVTPPTDAEVNAWFQANPARVQGATLDKVRGPIRSMLVQERIAAARDRFLDVLKAKTPVKILLDPPREKVADAGRPSRGPDNAPVEIIEFSDFQCPFCLRSYPVVKQILSVYGDRVRLVYRHFPLPNHPDARPAAEAAACAAEQGKFWEYHNHLFENQSKLSDTDLKQDAAALGLDLAKFNVCVNTRKYQKDVDADIAAGNNAGVTGTPAFFINGRPLEGALPFEAFKQVIDDELGRSH